MITKKYRIDMTSEVHNIDCLELMRTLPDKCFQLAIADPPYGGAGNEQIDGGGQIWSEVRPLQAKYPPHTQAGKHIKLDSTSPKDRMFKYRKTTPPSGNSTTPAEECSSDTKEPG
ncbi:MAG: site-specific DNA-methyltransferase [Bacteroidales bacterium]|nr:site-specific DNA-methyltransferase [Bacteroidales bacterium]